MGEEEYNTPDGTKIKRVERVKDLGDIFQEDGSFISHIADVKTRAINMSVWLLRTFKNQSMGSTSFLYKKYCWCEWCELFCKFLTSSFNVTVSHKPTL